MTRTARTPLAHQVGFTERLFASRNDKALARVIDVGLNRVEDGLVSQLRFADGLADTTGRYLFDAGGKRVRPMLMLLAAELGDGATEAVITAAQALEITHLASLYHDDVMDDAQMRRGVPSTQVVWGNSVAVLTGDLLFSRASKLMATLGERAISIEADTFERLCLGQLHETVGPGEDDNAIEHYLQVLADKTGSLIAAAAQMGIIFSGAPAEYEQPMVTFGSTSGVAFQLIDDVLDLAPSGETGKSAGTDLRSGVATLPMLRLRETAVTDAGAADLLARLERDVIGSAADADVTGAIAELHNHEVTAQTLAEAHRWAAEAVAALEPLPDGQVRSALIRFTETIVNRTH